MAITRRSRRTTATESARSPWRAGLVVGRAGPDIHVRYRPPTDSRPLVGRANLPSGSATRMTFRAKPVVQRSQKPSWESRDRRNFFLNLGFGLAVVDALLILGIAVAS